MSILPVDILERNLLWPLANTFGICLGKRLPDRHINHVHVSVDCCSSLIVQEDVVIPLQDVSFCTMKAVVSVERFAENERCGVMRGRNEETHPVTVDVGNSDVLARSQPRSINVNEIPCPAFGRVLVLAHVLPDGQLPSLGVNHDIIGHAISVAGEKYQQRAGDIN